MDLTREQITEGNDVLAKLLGWYEQEEFKGSWYVNTQYAKYVAYSEHNHYPHKGLPFHRDWNELMPIIDKIGELIYDITNWKDNYSYMEVMQRIIYRWVRSEGGKADPRMNLMNNIEDVWEACVVYVKWYNKNEE